MINTSLAAASACLPSFFSRRLRGEPYDLLLLCNALIGGLVSITASCAIVQPWFAVIIGCKWWAKTPPPSRRASLSLVSAVFAGLLYLFSARAIKLMGIDDPLDAFSVHGTCGAWGLLRCAVLPLPRCLCLHTPLLLRGLLRHTFVFPPPSPPCPPPPPSPPPATVATAQCGFVCRPRLVAASCTASGC